MIRKLMSITYEGRTIFQRSEEVALEAAGEYSFCGQISKKYLFCIKRADPKKKSPPKLQRVTAGMRQLGFKALSSNTNVPMKYITPPSPANRSTQKPLSSSSMSSLTGLPSVVSERNSFHVCEMTMNAEPMMKRRLPSQARSSAGMKKAEPTRQSSDPATERRKLRERARKGQSVLVQCIHSVMSAMRKVKEPMVQSHAETSKVSRYSLTKGKRMKDPAMKVLPPMKQLSPCHNLQHLLFQTVDFTSISNPDQLQHHITQSSEAQGQRPRLPGGNRVRHHLLLELPPFRLVLHLLAVVLLRLPLALADSRCPPQQFERLLGDGDDLTGRFGHDIEGEALGEVFLREVVPRGVGGHHQLLPLVVLTHLQLLAHGPLQKVVDRLRDLALLDQEGPEGQAVQREELAGRSQRLLRNALLEDLRLPDSPEHLFPLLLHPDGQAGRLPARDHCHQRSLEGEGEKLLLPVIGAAEAVALGEEDDILLIIDVRLALVEADLAVEDEVEALGLLLLLEDEGLLPKLGEEHAAADVVDGGEVLDALDGLEVEEDVREGIDVGYRPLLWLAHQDLEDHSQVVLLDVVQVQPVEPYLLLAEDPLHSISKLYRKNKDDGGKGRDIASESLNIAACFEG